LGYRAVSICYRRLVVIRPGEKEMRDADECELRAQKMRVGLSGRVTGVGFKPHQAAMVKNHGGER
jgi:hypothetical protein